MPTAVWMRVSPPHTGGSAGCGRRTNRSGQVKGGEPVTGSDRRAVDLDRACRGCRSPGSGSETLLRIQTGCTDLWRGVVVALGHDGVTAGLGIGGDARIVRRVGRLPGMAVAGPSRGTRVIRTATKTPREARCRRRCGVLAGRYGGCQGRTRVIPRHPAPEGVTAIPRGLSRARAA